MGGILNGEAYDFGFNEDSLMYYVRAQEDSIRTNLPAYTWTFSFPNPPKAFYFLMDASNIAKLFDFNAQTIYLNSSLSTTPTTLGLDNLLQLEAAGSPRGTWPTTEGTDGQRLREGQSSSDGFALNYLAKLYFLTSNLAFKALFDSLKAGKISSAKALASAKAIVES